MLTNRLIVSLENFDFNKIKQIVNELNTNVNYYKINLNTLLTNNQNIINWLKEQNKKVLCDFKLFDTTHSLLKILEKLYKLKVDAITISLYNDFYTLDRLHYNYESIDFIGVQSLSTDSFKRDYPDKHKLNLMQGIVVNKSNYKFYDNLYTYLVGIKPIDKVFYYQKHCISFKEAVNTNCDYLILGRAITHDNNYLKNLEELYKTLNEC